MKIKWMIVFSLSLLFLAGGIGPVFAVQHSQKEGLFSMDIPEGWHWVEYPEEIVVTYADGSTVAIDIQLVQSRNLAQKDIKNILKEGNDKMIKEGIEAHQGTLIDNKEINLNGVSATQLDFKTAPPNSIDVAYISFFNNGYAVTITYGSPDEKMRLMLDDVVATIKF